ncbi:MAG TPA: CDP-alcohol phosphatidyltransferase family protein [Clostridiaceae bacterium]|nr:CDP-alcohol phosphatidyltransferase family protein [Clostridiaceae bacterium]
MSRLSKIAFPDALTYANLCLGIISILTSLNGSYKLSALLIIAACLADRYGGIAGKRLKVSSDYGRQLVSLANFVSFGIAPSILVFMLYGFEAFGAAGYLLVLVFPVAAAHRIAAGRCAQKTAISFFGSPVLAGTTLAVFALITADKPVLKELAVIIVAALSYMLASRFTSTRG